MTVRACIPYVRFRERRSGCLCWAGQNNLTWQVLKIHGKSNSESCFSLLSQNYSAHAAYCQSKLAQLLFSSHLHQELQSGGSPLSSCAVDPGMVNTALYRHLWTPLYLAQSAIARLLFRVKHFSFILFINSKCENVLYSLSLTLNFINQLLVIL